jgi:hypothetical protein
VAAIAAVLVAGYLLVLAPDTHGGAGGPTGTAQAAATESPLSTQSPLTAQSVRSAASAFLAAWQSGDDAKAAALTDSPAPARAALDAYRDDLHPSPLVIRLTSADADGTVQFSVAATVSLPAGAAGAGSRAAGGTWDYSSRLSVYGVAGSLLVEWGSAVLNPDLGSGTHLLVAALPSTDNGQATVTDAQHNDLADSPEQTLQKVAARLSTNGPGQASAPGIEVEVVDASGNPESSVDPFVVTQPGTVQVATTIDANVEKAALSAVGQNQGSSMVVLQPTTGHILAIANNDDGLDDALMTQIAPGSTMKVVTSTAMLDNGLSAQSPVACPAEVDVKGAITGNSGGETRPASTPLIDDFAASCNNAFAEQYPLLSGDLLAHTAQRYFGLNEPWDIGLGEPTTYFTIPTGQSDAEVAAEAFGQGKLEASPLAMASVAATVDTGSFHQPVLLAGAGQVSATALPESTDSQLQQMMRAVISYPDGTAHGVGFGQGVYAKTGTADAQSGYPPNSWMIAYDPGLNLAIGCVVLNAGSGGEYAGPETLSVLQAMAALQ